MFASKIFRDLLLVGMLCAAMLFAISCGGSKANVRTEATPASAPPTVEVTTAPAILRELPRSSKTGSLAGSADDSRLHRRKVTAIA